MKTREFGPRWVNLIPKAREKVQRLIELAAYHGLRVVFVDGWRAPAESKKNIANGTSRLKDPLNSMHVWGLAFDLAFVDDNNRLTWLEDATKPADWVDPRWIKLAMLGEQLGLYSGGLNWRWDWPHFQLNGYDIKEIRKTYGDNYMRFLVDNGVRTI